MKTLLETICEIIKIAEYKKRLNTKPFKPMKPKKPHKPKVLRKAPRPFKKRRKPNLTPIITATELKLAGFGLYPFKYLKDVLERGGEICVKENDSPSKIKSVEKMVQLGLLELVSDEPKVYKLTNKGRTEAVDILSDTELRHPRTFKSPNFLKSASKTQKFVDFIKHQIKVDISPFIDPKWSTRNRINLDLEKMDRKDQNSLKQLAHSSGKFKISDAGGLGVTIDLPDL